MLGAGRVVARRHGHHLLVAGRPPPSPIPWFVELDLFVLISCVEEARFGRLGRLLLFVSSKFVNRTQRHFGILLAFTAMLGFYVFQSIGLLVVTHFLGGRGGCHPVFADGRYIPTAVNPKQEGNVALRDGRA
jgi:hypothetical protein